MPYMNEEQEVSMFLRGKAKWMLWTCLGLLVTAHADESVPKIAVLDFMTTDQLVEQYDDFEFEKLAREKADSLSDADRKSINSIMQGIIKGIDAWSNLEAAEDRREEHDLINKDKWRRSEALMKKLRSGPMRPVVAAADYMMSYLGEYPDSLQTVDRPRLAAALQSAEFTVDGSIEADSMARFRQTTGATHLLYGTVTDVKRMDRQFSGYGIKTDMVVYELDVMVKLVDLESEAVVFSTIATGYDKMLKSAQGQTLNSQQVQDLLKDALHAAALDVQQFVNPPKKAASVVTANMPALVKLQISPRGGDNFVPEDVTIFVDGKFKGNAPAELSVTPGIHEIELKAAGFESLIYEMEVHGGEKLSPRMKQR